MNRYMLMDDILGSIGRADLVMTEADELLTEARLLEHADTDLLSLFYATSQTVDGSHWFESDEGSRWLSAFDGEPSLQYEWESHEQFKNWLDRWTAAVNARREKEGLDAASKIPPKAPRHGEPTKALSDYFDPKLLNDLHKRGIKYTLKANHPDSGKSHIVMHIHDPEGPRTVRSDNVGIDYSGYRPKVTPGAVRPRAPTPKTPTQRRDDKTALWKKPNFEHPRVRERLHKYMHHLAAMSDDDVRTARTRHAVHFVTHAHGDTHLQRKLGYKPETPGIDTATDEKEDVRRAEKRARKRSVTAKDLDAREEGLHQLLGTKDGSAPYKMLRSLAKSYAAAHPADKPAPENAHVRVQKLIQSALKRRGGHEAIKQARSGISAQRETDITKPDAEESPLEKHAAAGDPGDTHSDHHKALSRMHGLVTRLHEPEHHGLLRHYYNAHHFKHMANVHNERAAAMAASLAKLNESHKRISDTIDRTRDRVMRGELPADNLKRHESKQSELASQISRQHKLAANTAKSARHFAQLHKKASEAHTNEVKTVGRDMPMSQHREYSIMMAHGLAALGHKHAQDNTHFKSFKEKGAEKDAATKEESISLFDVLFESDTPPHHIVNRYLSKRGTEEEEAERAERSKTRKAEPPKKSGEPIDYDIGEMGPGADAATIADSHGVSKATVSRILDKMSSLGDDLIQKAPITKRAKRAFSAVSQAGTRVSKTTPVALPDFKIAGNKEPGVAHLGHRRPAFAASADVAQYKWSKHLQSAGLPDEPLTKEKLAALEAFLKARKARKEAAKKRKEAATASTQSLNMDSGSGSLFSAIFG